METDLPVIYLHQGEYHYSNKPAIVVTVLGSCISITMFNARLGVSVITHCQMPVCNTEREMCRDCGNHFRYVDCSISKLTEFFSRFNITPEEIEVKVFGGADVLPEAKGSRRLNSIGMQNIKTATEALRNAGFEIRSSDTGGVNGRKIFFFTHTGDVYMTKLKNNMDVCSTAAQK